ncbi:MAG: DUF3240 family protein [Pseudomonadota bacterium]
MPDALLTLHCARADAQALVEALRDVVRVPIQQLEEVAHGHDYGDADTSEQVAGALRRALLQMVLPEQQVAAAVEAARTSRRRLPFRWHSVAVIASGRFE